MTFRPTVRFGRILGGLMLAVAWPEAGAAEAVGRPLGPWTRGQLEIHHIATGRGNAALVIGPDGTTLLIDAGEAGGTPEALCPPRPDGSRRPGEWIARYARRRLAPTGRAELDYAVVSHLHPDHLGNPQPDSPRSKQGDWALAGLTEVAEHLPVRSVIDRGYPDYSYPRLSPAGFARNYHAFIAARRRAGAPDARLVPGSADQIRLVRAPQEFPAFAVRNLAANGVVWTGRGTETATAVPPLADLAPADYPDENMCSVALRISYGKFDYFTGGDLHCDTAFGTMPWRDIETPAARAAGPVEVATANHHGYFDAVGPDSVRALQPRLWITQAWHLTHLNMGVLERMLSPRLYAGPRDVVATDLLPATALMNERFMKQVRATLGHIVVRVAADGASFTAYVTECRDETDTVLDVLGPFPCR